MNLNTMSNLLNVSAVVFTKNEIANLDECLNCLIDFSEIIVVDSYSTDGTQDRARLLGARIVDFNWNGQYPKKRQWSLDSIDFSNNWILFVDADERVTVDLVREIRTFLDLKLNYSAGSIPLDYYFAGKRLMHGQKVRKTSLLRINQAIFNEVDDLKAVGMGELEGHYQPTIHGKTKNFKSSIVHNDNDSISTWMVRHVNYAKWEAHLLLNKSAKDSVNSAKGKWQSMFHKLPFRPLAFFIYSYFLRFGFLDGRAGFDYAFAKSWYYWLSEVIAREGKL